PLPPRLQILCQPQLTLPLHPHPSLIHLWLCRHQPRSACMSNREPPRTRTGFQGIVEHHTNMVDDDDLDDEPVRASGIIGHPVSVGELFDFSQSHCVDLYAKTARRSFDEELEL